MAFNIVAAPDGGYVCYLTCLSGQAGSMGAISAAQWTSTGTP